MTQKRWSNTLKYSWKRFILMAMDLSSITGDDVTTEQMRGTTKIMNNIYYEIISDDELTQT